MRTVVVYGNCQAEQIMTILGWIPAVTNRFRLVHYSSFERPPGTEILEASAGDIAQCALLVGHPNEEQRPIDRNALPGDCVTVTFPPLDLNALWPFATPNVFNAPERGRPWGYFPYGDRVVLRCVRDGMSAREALAYYLTAWDAYAPNLGRLFEIERHRLAARDDRCDIKMGAYVLETFRNQRLFWTRNHPSGTIVRELALRVLHACSTVVPELAAVTEAHLEPHTPPEWPFGALQIPIHPRVAQFFDLRWYDPGQRYRWYDTSYSYEEYFAELIARSVDVHDRLGAVPAAEPP